MSRRKINVPYRHQHTNYTCGPAVLSMVMAFFGDHRTEQELAKRTSANAETGTAHAKMIALAQAEGFYVYINSQSTIHELKHFVDQHLPVIVNYIEPATDEGHYAVVSGYTKRGLVLHDPWNGADFHLPYATFNARWHDSHKTHEYLRWLMVMNKQDFHFGKMYKPHTLSGVKRKLRRNK